MTSFEGDFFSKSESIEGKGHDTHTSKRSGSADTPYHIDSKSIHNIDHFFRKLRKVITLFYSEVSYDLRIFDNQKDDILAYGIYIQNHDV